MKKIIFILILLISINIYSDIIVNSSGPFYVGDPIGFNKDCHDSGRGTSTWDFGDGTTISYGDDLNHGWQMHTFETPGTYKVSYTHGSTFVTPECGTSPAPFTEIMTITVQSKRAIIFSPSSPKEDQKVWFLASNFTGPYVNWNFGDGTALTGSMSLYHRYNTSGKYIVTAAETSIEHSPIRAYVTVLPDDRFLSISTPEVMINTPITVSANNFYGDGVLWNFGDGTEIIAPPETTHTFTRPGDYTITARDESGESSKVFQIQIKVIGISNDVTLDVAEIIFQNGKYYKVVSRNSKNIKAVLRLRMKGTGTVTGYWIVDDAPYGIINELAIQGELKEITTKDALPLPTSETGIHTVSFKLTKPNLEIEFPTLKYYVLPYENKLETFSPPDGFVAKEKEIPEFRWNFTKDSIKYQIAFSNSLYMLLNPTLKTHWFDVGPELSFLPDKELWNGLKRNRWSYWKVRALDSSNNVVSESGVNRIKIVVASAEVTIKGVTDIDGNIIVMGKNGIKSNSDVLLVKGNIEYKGNSKYLILRVFIDDSMVDQLLFRDVKKGESRDFETSVPNKKGGKIIFQVLKTSSPSVIVGLKGILLKK